ncbi:unnamed protein product [Blepharisma stoltei]|uniref:UBA domain-containing protein n=1 Tax=Blepharisma stoltei TaxID=1481888 RepID=A0AAU9JP51_9CILI|nr:unnamed protein product [Blepharisma stoltei]
MTTLKLQLGEEIRRVGKPPSNINEIRQKAKELFGIEEASFKYKDEDGDILTIQTQDEYEDILTQHEGPFKLEVIDYQVLLMRRTTYLSGESPESFELDSFHDFCKSQTPETFFKGNSFKLSQKLASSPISERKKVTENTSEINSASIQTEEVRKNEIGVNSLSHSDNWNDAVKFNDSASQCTTENSEYNEIRMLFRELLNNYADEYLDDNKFNNIKCSNCGNSIGEIIFSCGVCLSFFLCKDCEISCQHPHNLLKYRQNCIKQKMQDIEPESPFLVKRKPKAPEAPPSKKILQNSESAALQINSPIVKGPLINDNMRRPKAEVPNSEIKELFTKLISMGFTSTQEFYPALTENGYNLEKTVEFLLANQ